MMIRSPLVPLLAAALLAVAGPAAAQTAEKTPPERPGGECRGRVTATGLGEARAVPDRLTAHFQVERQAQDPGTALSDASQAVAAVLEALKAQGVAERDVATASVSLNPVRERPERDRAAEITGWRAGSSLRVTLADPSGFGAVASAATEAGATGIGGVSMEVSDPEPLREQARAAAVEHALAKARGMAEAAGLKPGRVLRLNEGVEDGGRGPEMFARAAAMSSADMPVAPGEQVISARAGVVMSLCR